MKFLVASMRHHLLPLHHRLKLEGQDSELVVWRPRYERAWDGLATKILRHSDGSLRTAAFESVVGPANRGEVAVVTDVTKVAEVFAAAPHLFRTWGSGLPAPRDRLLIGGWFDGEQITAPHLLVADWGSWMGGLGAAVLGGLTLVRLGTGGDVPGFASGAAQAATMRLKSAGFRGLFHMDVEEDPTSGELSLRGMEAGWPWLHTQVFVAELESLANVLQGGVPVLKHRFVTGVVMSTPPWPSEKHGALEDGVPLEGLTPAQLGRAMWHDIIVDPVAGKLRTAGLDGLLGVALGASDSTPHLARARALELCGALQVPALQFRPDAGLTVDAALSTLEERWGFAL